MPRRGPHGGVLILRSVAVPVPADVRLGFHPDDTTPIPTAVALLWPSPGSGDLQNIVETVLPLK